MTPFI